MTRRSILIVEDDEPVRETLADCLAGEHDFSPVTAKTLDDAEAIITDEDRAFDAGILDIGMPDGDGRDFCAKLRRQGHALPILMLSGRGGEADIISGLDCGANDCIAKPFRLNELLARLRAQLRLFEARDAAVFTVGPYVFHPAKKLLRNGRENRRVWLTAKELAILRFLCRADGRLVDRETLLQGVWGPNATATRHMLETHLYRLRQKIEPDPKRPVLLLTERGAYRLDLAARTTGGA